METSQRLQIQGKEGIREEKIGSQVLTDGGRRKREGGISEGGHPDGR